MKCILIVLCLLMTACTTTLPLTPLEVCAVQRKEILEREAKLKVRRAFVQEQLKMAVPTEPKNSLVPRTVLVNDFNKLVDELEALTDRHNSECYQK